MSSRTALRPPVSHANRGAGLEHLIEHTWEFYRRRGWGCGQKVATPTRQIRQAAGQDPTFRRERSTVDFLGVYAGVPLAFDAKQTRGRAFPLAKTLDHQVRYLEDFAKAGGQAFLIVEFLDAKRIFAVTPGWLFDTAEELKRRSVPIVFFAAAAGLGIGCWELVAGLAGVPLHFGSIVEAKKDVPRGTGGHAHGD